jgi:hypothetical protein
MTERRHRRDRRGEARRPQAGRIRWRRARNGPTLAAWTSDASASSLAFVAAARLSPTAGDEVEVLGADGGRQRYAVARVSAYDQQLALVACRRLPAPLTAASLACGPEGRP